MLCFKDIRYNKISENCILAKTMIFIWTYSNLFPIWKCFIEDVLKFILLNIPLKYDMVFVDTYIPQLEPQIHKKSL